MAFRATYPPHPDGHYTDNDVYEFLEGGVLAITHGDAQFDSEYYAPHKWDFVFADHDHKPGRTKDSPPPTI